MDCITLIACFSFYVDGGLQFQNNRVTELLVTPVPGGQYTTEYTHSSNPYARVAIGYELQGKRWVAFAEAFHVSSVETGRDKGINGLALGVRWYPFQ
jgi:hypothetical protein